MFGPYGLPGYTHIMVDNAGNTHIMVDNAGYTHIMVNNAGYNYIMVDNAGYMKVGNAGYIHIFVWYSWQYDKRAGVRDECSQQEQWPPC